MAEGKTPRPWALPRDIWALPSVATIARAFLGVLLVAFVVVLVFALSDVLIIFLLSIFLATVLDPGVQMLHRRGLPVSIGILLHYAVFFAVALFLILSLVPILAEQITELTSLSTNQINSFLSNPTISLPLLRPTFNDRLSHLLQSMLQQQDIQQVSDALQRLALSLSAIAGGSLQFATEVVGSVFRFLLNLVIVLTLTFFLELEREGVLSWVFGIIPHNWRPYAEKKATLIHRKLAQWAKGQLLLCLVIGVLVFFVLLILQVPYALTLALLAGFTEFIPYVGPFIAAIPAVFISLVHGGFMWALIVAGAYYLVQWCENNLIVPLIMKHAVNISPVAIIFGMLVGVSFPTVIHPVLGILISIPVISVISIFLEDFRYSSR